MIEPVYNHAGIKLYRGDSRVLATEPLGRIHAVVTDPPYELGIDGHRWDRTGVAFDARFWRRVLSRLVPGAWAIVFGAPRFLGRLHLALEDGGFTVEDTGAWIYGQGWPKGRTRLKPAWEPWVLCRKPGPSRELNVDEAGIGGPLPSRTQPVNPKSMLNTRATERSGVLPGRESRYPTNVILDPDAAAELDRQSGFSRSKREVHTHRPRPNDLYLENRTIPNVAGHDDEGGASRFFQVCRTTEEDIEWARANTAARASSPPTAEASGSAPAAAAPSLVSGQSSPAPSTSATESASSLPPTSDTETTPARPSPGAPPDALTQSQRPANAAEHPTPTDTTTTTESPPRSDGSADPATSPSTSPSEDRGARVYGSRSELPPRFRYVAKPGRAEKDLINRHVSVKPLDLMLHLVELVSRSGETVWDPFLGSGTTGVACQKLGRRFIGMELDQRSLDVASRRLRRASIRGGHDGDDLDDGAPGSGAPEPVELQHPGREGAPGSA